MKIIVVSVFVALICNFAHAQQAPIVGVWEQLPVADGHGGPNAVRRNIVFVDHKIADDTVFSGLVDAGTKSSVLCCVKVSKNSSITLPELLKKYQWDEDIADHLKKITGWKYIYEASLVDQSVQNAGMRELVKDLTMPPALSPYSAAIISVKITGEEVNKKFTTSDGAISFSTQSSQNSNIIQYKFSVNGEQVKLTEGTFPD
ncbi:hypothetical protein bAD24_I10800 [Burkholderia sp. AD24]|uniref:Uncharacterized protein n=1 Tax=Paraburkholderia bryophila TaxID=420952 RepID=A0A329C884_9BURK|nr:hypothetical protein [Paraburkholderia bryophila]ASL43972.1 hypothetical protein bAD24_I10800 [Burkholderia sp. AD24]RAS27794.1 hypothetical protein BX591_1121 [Paraburkholderia bryophila]